MQTGYYVGAGATRSITGVGFRPDLVIIKADTSVGRAVWKSSSMTDGTTAYFENTVVNTGGLITSLDSDGFSLATGADVNSKDIRYAWTAFRSSTGSNFAVGKYSGSGIDNTKITTGFQPDLVWIKRNGVSQGLWASSAMAANANQYFAGNTGSASNKIKSPFETDGFKVGNDTEINEIGSDYYYVAFKQVTGSMAVGTYSGNGLDDQSITVGFKPDLVWLKQSFAVAADDAAMRNNQNNGDTCNRFTNNNNVTNNIQALETNGFQIGTDTRVNSAVGGQNTYYYVAFKGATTPTPSNVFRMASGSYTGNGLSQSITSVGFQPDLVMIKSDTTTHYAVFTTSSMAPDSTAYFANNVVNFTGGITSLTSTGFTVGSSVQVNSGVAPAPIYYWWAFGNSGSTNFKVGAYTGTGAGSRSIPNLGFQPDLVVIKGNTAQLGVFRTSSIAGDNTALFTNLADVADRIMAIESGGFQVGANGQVNTAAATYFYFAFKNTTDQFKASTYTGDATDPHSVTLVGFQPELALVKRDGTNNAVFRGSNLSGDWTQYFANAINTADRIQGLESDGFQVGGGTGGAALAEVNTAVTTYRYTAWRSAPASKLSFAAQPATTEVGVTISPAVEVEVQDLYGNRMTQDNSTSITLAIGTNPGSGTLSGTKTKTVSSGVASFSGLSINNPGNGYTLVASATGLTSATSTTFNITPEAAPSITGVSPADLAVGVATSETAKVTFSETMNQSSVANALRLKAIRDKDGNTIDIQIDGTYSWSGTTVTFTPNSNLTKNYTYQVTVSTEAADLVGDHLASTFSASFETILDHTASLTVIGDDGKTKVVIPANAYNKDFYIKISTDPENHPVAVTPSYISSASTKLAGENNTFRHPLTGELREFVAYDVSNTRITDALASDATVYIPYRDDDNDGYVDNVTPPAKVSALLNYKLDEGNKLWVRVPGSVVDTATKLVSTPVKGFSVFTAMASPANDLSLAYAFPNPFKPNSNLGHTSVTFTNLASSCTIKIFTLSGDLVRSIIHTDSAGSLAQEVWNVKNDAGENVASGLYFWVIKSSIDTKMGKLVVIR